MRPSLFALRSALLIACMAVNISAFAASFKADPDLAEQAIPQFHMALNADDIAGVYNRGADELRQRESLKDFTARLEGVRSKMGEVRGTKRQRWQARKSGKDIFVTLRYKTSYSAGEADEEFVVRMRDNTPAISKYQIRMPKLAKP